MIRRLFRRRAVAAVLATAAVAGIAAAIVPAFAPSNPAARAAAATSASPSPAHRGHRGPGIGSGAVALGSALARETAKQSGLTESALLADLRSGKTLSQIAGSKAQSVVNTVLGALQQRLAKAVSSGRLSAAQEQSRLAQDRAEAQAIMSMDLAPFIPAQTSRPHRGQASPSPSPASTSA